MNKLPNDFPKFPKWKGKIPQEEAEKRVKVICEYRNYTFLGFCDKDGNECDYKNWQTYLKLHCNICKNDWYSTNYNNLLQGKGCTKCKKNKLSQRNSLDLNTVLEQIYNKCKEKKYSFLGFCDKNGRDCKWYGNTTYLKLHCNVCGNDWNTTTYSHFINRGNGCLECGKKKIGGFKRLDLETVLNKIHEKCVEKNYEFLGFCDKNGEDCNYNNASTYLKLHCNICGNDWYSTNYNKFIHGRGCPQCSSSHLEDELRLFLKNEKFEQQKRFDWLGQQKLDFYLPQYNVAIECQGIQHFVSNSFFGGEEGFKKTQSRDQRKKQLCEEHKIKLLYYSNLHIDYPYQVYEDKEELLQKILEESN